MNRILIVTTLIAAAGLAQAQSKDITGDWQGTLSAGGARTPPRPARHQSRRRQSQSQSRQRGPGSQIPVNSITFQDSKLSLSLDSIHGAYEGKVSTDGNAISGIWTQGQSFPTRSSNAVRRPSLLISTAPGWACSTPARSSSACGVPHPQLRKRPHRYHGQPRPGHERPARLRGEARGRLTPSRSRQTQRRLRRHYHPRQIFHRRQLDSGGQHAGPDIETCKR